MSATPTITQIKLDGKREEAAGLEAAIARLTAERTMHGQTPRNGLPFWESSAMYEALRVAVQHAKGNLADVRAQIAELEASA